MSSIYLNPQPSSSPIPFQDFNGDHQLLGQIHDLASSSTSLSYTNFDMIHSYEESLALEYSRHPQEIKVNNILSLEKPNNIGHMLQSSSSSWPQNLVQDSSSGSSSYGYSSNNHDGRNKMEHVANSSDQIKLSRRSWKPSKVRIMQKMMANSNKDNIGEQKLHLDLKQQQGNITKIGNNNEGNNGIRVCSDCHTTTTPLWRSGPLGPKSLCNACGIRQRKARRAAMAAAAAAAASSGLSNDGIATPMCAEPPKSEPRDQEVYKSTLDNKNTHPLPHKKRGKIVNASKNYFGNNSYNNNNNNNNNNGLTTSSKDYITTTSQRVFPRDEEEGAILLMALSCGLACSS